VDPLSSKKRKRDESPAQIQLAEPEAIFVAHNTGFPYYGYMNITLTLDEKLVKNVRKIAVERDTTLTGLVRAYLESLAVEHSASGRKRHEREAVERSFSQFQFRVGKKTWKREDLYARS
jgi:hypothetical protein